MTLRQNRGPQRRRQRRGGDLERGHRHQGATQRVEQMIGIGVGGDDDRRAVTLPPGVSMRHFTAVRLQPERRAARIDPDARALRRPRQAARVRQGLHGAAPRIQPRRRNSLRASQRRRPVAIEQPRRRRRNSATDATRACSLQLARGSRRLDPAAAHRHRTRCRGADQLEHQFRPGCRRYLSVPARVATRTRRSSSSGSSLTPAMTWPPLSPEARSPMARASSSTVSSPRSTQVQGRRQAGIARAHDCDLGAQRALQPWKIDSGRRRRRPERLHVSSRALARHSNRLSIVSYRTILGRSRRPRQTPIPPRLPVAGSMCQTSVLP